MDLTDFVYTPIRPWQCRIISLHGHGGSPESTLRCDLLPAYLTHDKFEGVAARLRSGEERLITFEALSYTWGGEETPEFIICDGFMLRIGTNLFEALKHLRYPDQTPRYLWVDAICLNQKDAQEKSHQIENMFAIYQKARRVVAWLGSAESIVGDIEKALEVGISVESSNSTTELLVKHTTITSDNFQHVYSFMKYIYTREWFERIWVQQEVFAAKTLLIQCGKYLFDWPQFLSTPQLLRPLLNPVREGPCQEEFHPEESREAITVLEESSVQLDSIIELELLCSDKLRAFEVVRSNGQKLDLIDALLTTGRLGATNPLDIVYGIAGIVDFPMIPMSINDWAVQTCQNTFVPIDYEAHFNCVLAAVSWVIIMKMGLRIIARFKIFDREESSDQPLSLPSWAINWKLTSSLFTCEHWAPIPDFGLNLKNAVRNPTITGSSALWRESIQQQFASENMVPNRLEWNKICVRGIIEERIQLQGSSASVSDGSLLSWKLEFTTKPGDIAVYLAPFDNTLCHASRCNYMDNFQFKHTELWILRCVTCGTGNLSDAEYKLMACLSGEPRFDPTIYSNWELSANPDIEARYSSLWVVPQAYYFLNRVIPSFEAFSDAQQFVIV